MLKDPRLVEDGRQHQRLQVLPIVQSLQLRLRVLRSEHVGVRDSHNWLLRGLQGIYTVLGATRVHVHSRAVDCDGKVVAKLHLTDVLVLQAQKRVRRLPRGVVVQSKLGLLILAPDPNHSSGVYSRVRVLSHRG